MNNKHYIGRDVRSLEHYDKVGPITGVSILVDENNEYVAGDMTGYVFETTCPYGTQAMANAMLASLQGKVYKGFRATDALIDKNAELGDGITIDGEYYVNFQKRVSDFLCPDNIVGASLTAKKGLGETWDNTQNRETTDDPITDISIEFNDTIIIIEVI